MAAMLLISLAACSGNDTDKEPNTAKSKATPASMKPATPAKPKGSSQEAALKRAVADYTTAYFKPNADAAHAMLSKSCRAKVDKIVYAGVLRQAAKDYGQHKAVNIHVDQLAGNLARVSYDIEGLPKLNQTAQPWAREGSQWHHDSC
ncbi:hypothetical protein ACFY12_35190 [Streptomyces sp. NPDC001339]|uniref:hypothetical protein n=1 Tax=Streptomyces sp. NPDC001339 TaxID=3364563 RepID=UPI0036753EB6